MAESLYTNYQLYRTLPKLSGNMQLDLVVAPGGNSKAYVRQAHLRPVHGTNYVPVVDERIMVRPHQNNIKIFHDRTRGSFYDSNPPAKLSSSWYMTISKHEMSQLKYIKNWDDDLWAGAKRMSYKLYGTTHEILVPLWLEKGRGVKLTITSGSRSYTLNLSEEYLYGYDKNGRCYNNLEPFHNDFVRYWMDYMDYLSLGDGNNRVMKVDLDSGVADIFGLQVESGNLVTRQNYNLVRNLTYRVRPLLEANSLLTNTFQDTGLICPHLINLNLCLNPADFFSGRGDTVVRDTISVTTEVLRDRSDKDILFQPSADRSDLFAWYRTREGNYFWETLGLMDFYTNHDYIPRQFVDYENELDGTYKDESYRLNALDYKKDYQCTDQIHANKITQGICHWSLMDNNVSGQHLFNLYDGFGAYANVNGELVEYNHFFGTATDTLSDRYDPVTDNTVWAGIPEIGDGGLIENILNAPQKYINSGYFKDASSDIGGIQFNYQQKVEEDPAKVWLGTMTTPWYSDVEKRKTWASSMVDSRYSIGILIERYNQPGNMDLPKTRNGQADSGFDKAFDWHYHSDVDNRFAIRKVKDGVVQYLYYRKDKLDEQGGLVDNPTLPAGWKDEEGNHKGAYKDILCWSTLENMKANTDRDSWVRVGGLGDYDVRGRRILNASVLYINMRRKTQSDGLQRPEDDLCVILYQPRARISNAGHPKANTDILFHDLNPHGLTIGGLSSAIKDYYLKYLPCMQAIELARTDPDSEYIKFPNDSNLPNLTDLKHVWDAMASIRPQKVVSFNHSIRPVTDDTLSIRSKEVIYYKEPEVAGEYVYRGDGNIRPAMFEEKVKVDGKSLIYQPLYGRNFAYYKKKIFTVDTDRKSQLTPSQRLFISTGVPPRYPSLGYDSVALMTRPVPESTKGDILYDYPIPVFSGQDWDGTDLTTLEPYSHYLLSNHPQNMDTAYDTLKWFEYKWFNKSTYTLFPERLEFDIQVTGNNDRSTLEHVAWVACCWPGESDYETKYEGLFYDESGAALRWNYVVSKDSTYIRPIKIDSARYVPDAPLIRSLYDFEFHLKTAEPLTDSKGDNLTDSLTGEVLYRYNYRLIATLK